MLIKANVFRKVKKKEKVALQIWNLNLHFPAFLWIGVLHSKTHIVYQRQIVKEQERIRFKDALGNEDKWEATIFITRMELQKKLFSPFFQVPKFKLNVFTPTIV